MKSAREMVHNRVCQKEGCRYGSAPLPTWDPECKRLDSMLDDVETESTETLTENTLALRQSAAMLEIHGRAAQVDVLGSAFYREYNTETAWRDGMRNGMGGAAGDLAGLIDPFTALSLAKLLREVESMGVRYPELVRDHDREVCGDHTCSVFGTAIQVAKGIKTVLGDEDYSRLDREGKS